MLKIPEETLGYVGQCIYCHTINGPLSDEHIIPYGLNGPWKLRKASCETCAKITGAFERLVLRGPFNEARIAARLPSRRKKKRPKTLPLRIERGGTNEAIEIPVEDYPGTIILPHFDSPAHLSGRDDDNIQVDGYTLFQLGGRNVDELGHDLSADRIEINATYKPIGAFARMLAKIAYGYAVVVAECDLTQFEEVYVLPAILGTSDDAGRWVGGVKDENRVAGSDLHHIKLTLVDGEIHVHVRLFAEYNAPEYIVIVGRMAGKKSVSEISLPKGAYWIH